MAEMGALVGWKQIGAYLGDVGVRTVQRWHKAKPLPLRMTPTGSPIAAPNELDLWRRNLPRLIFRK